MNGESQLIALLSASLLRPFVLVAAAVLVLCVFRVRHPASRHAVWSVVLFAMPLLPIAAVIAPQWRLPVLPAKDQAVVPAAIAAPEPLPYTAAAQTISLPPQPASPKASIGTFVVWCYFTGLLAMLLYRAVGWVMLRRVVARSAPLKRRMRESGDVVAPVAVGALRPLVLLPTGWRDWNADTRRAVLAHEFAHIRRNDTLISALARLVKCVLWFHPLAWWVSRKVSELAELACDAVALESVGDPGGYSRILLAFATGVNRAGYRVALPGLAMAASSRGMGKRIDHVFELSNGSLRKLTRPGAVLALIGLPVMCLAATVGLESIENSLPLQLPGIAIPKAPEPRIVAQSRAQAQTQAPPQAPAQAPAALTPALVHVTITDRNGAFVDNLQQSEFSVFENGVQQRLTLFREEQVPLSIGLLVDESGSMRDKGDKVAAAAKQLVSLSGAQDEMFIAGFNDNTYIDQDWTNDEGKLAAALDKREARGGSAWRDAVNLSIDKIQRGGKNETKVLLLITDGDDNTSHISLADLILKARQSGVAIYCIGLLNDPEARAAKRALHELAGDSGGQDYYPKSPAELTLAGPMMHNIRSQYILGYSPANPTLRAIKVIVSHPDLIVRTRDSSR
jgi:VWFA-related protein